MERKRLVLDANILIRGCLGVRVRNLIADYADRVDFFVAEANVAEAAGYIADLAREKNLDEVLCAEALLSLMRVVQLVEDTALESARADVTPFAAPVPMRAGGLVRPLSIAGGLPGACAPGEPNAVCRRCTRFGAALPITLSLVKMRRAQYLRIHP